MAISRPILRPNYRLEVVEGHGAFILSNSEQIVLRGSLYELVTPLLDGRPVEDVCKNLAGQVPPAKVFFTVKKLEQRGLVTESDDRPTDANAARWSEQGIDPVAATINFAEKTVSLKAVGIDDSDLAEFQSILQASNVKVCDEGDLVVVLTDHYLRRDLLSINRQAIEQNKPWILIKPVGLEIWTGPVFRPGTTACWECLATRMRCNHPILNYLENILESGECPTKDFIQTAATKSIAWGIAANAISTWIATDGKFDQLDGKIQSYDAITCELKFHTLQRDPVCNSCGEHRYESNGDVQPIELQTRRKKYTEDGGHRVSTPDETIENISTTSVQSVAPSQFWSVHLPQKTGLCMSILPGTTSPGVLRI